MKQISFEEHKKIQLALLREIDSFCRKNKINYFLAFGTLIGAVRHKGFIPWDDDIDIAMPRPDYNKFIHQFNDKVQNLKVLAPEIDLDYYAPYANVYDMRTILEEKGTSHLGLELGVKIDVFPIDGVPTNKYLYGLVSYIMRLYNYILNIKRRCDNKSFSFKIKKIICSLFGYRFLQKRIIKLAARFPYDESYYVDHFVFSAYLGKRFKKEALNSFVTIEFENEEYLCPIGYDEYLRKIYGNYMKLPPAEKQIPHHNFTAFWKE